MNNDFFQDSLVHSLNNDELFELIAEIIPGINHKANNILTKISGQVILACVHQTGTENKKLADVQKMVPDFCEQLASLMDKLLVLVRSSQKTSQNNPAFDCLSISLERFHKKVPHRLVQIDNQIANDCYIGGEGERLQRMYFYILMVLDACSHPSETIQVTVHSNPKEHQKTKSTHPAKYQAGVHVTFKTATGGDRLSDPFCDIFNPNQPVNLTSCYLTASELICQYFMGNFQIGRNQGIQIETIMPQRENFPTLPKQKKNSNKERTFISQSFDTLQNAGIKKKVS